MLESAAAEEQRLGLANQETPGREKMRMELGNVGLRRSCSTDSTMCCLCHLRGCFEETSSTKIGLGVSQLKMVDEIAGLGIPMT